jgi:hypothetical protein
MQVQEFQSTLASALHHNVLGPDLRRWTHTGSNAYDHGRIVPSDEEEEAETHFGCFGSLTIGVSRSGAFS